MDNLVRQDQKILDENPTITYDKLVWTKKHFIRRAYTKILQKFRLSTFFSLTDRLSTTTFLVNRNFRWQLGKALHAKSNLYIAHNLGALPVAAIAAKRLGSNSGFDAEDFHRQEVSDASFSKEYQATKLIEDTFIPQLNHFTAASPMIANAYTQLYVNKRVQTLNNVFSKNLFCQPKKQLDDQTLKLFWFSQTIGQGRGIEDVLKAIGQLRNPCITLSLLGAIDHYNTMYFKSVAKQAGLLANQLAFLAPVSPKEVFVIANQHDIGLALEQASPLNRDICLTNKIFTYLGAGLATIATETSAQRAFIEQFPQIGKSYKIGDIDHLASIIEYYYLDKEALKTVKNASYQLAKTTLNWELESEKFLKALKEIDSPIVN
ncbi:hypothetical protein ACJVDH_15070 [Pedobacter sp. AW1-32]|uniref:hypothetical protein n=1 Tax=Pedobacter sp. AW1-32 TaxID=3383026 RepID=UPI003FEE96AB